MVRLLPICILLDTPLDQGRDWHRAFASRTSTTIQVPHHYHHDVFGSLHSSRVYSSSDVLQASREDVAWGLRRRQLYECGALQHVQLHCVDLDCGHGLGLCNRSRLHCLGPQHEAAAQALGLWGFGIWCHVSLALAHFWSASLTFFSASISTLIRLPYLVAYTATTDALCESRP